MRKLWLGGAGLIYAAVVGGLSANLHTLSMANRHGIVWSWAGCMFVVGVVASLACWRIVGGRPMVH